MGLATNSGQVFIKSRECLTKSAWNSKSSMTPTRWVMSLATTAKLTYQVKRPRIGPRHGWPKRNGAFPLRRPRNAHNNGGSNEMGWVFDEGCKFSVQKCNMSDSGDMNVEKNLNQLDEVHIAAHLIHKPARVLIPHGTLVDVFTSEPVDPSRSQAVET
ncbi:uncharacterized protein DS421_9g265080 [Arachis hypogaea]|nr:uncharacterized protein DS421_9g265080 [Arachis hypogaea]